MAKKKKPNGPARTGKAIQVYLPPDLRDALDEATRQSRRSLTAEVCLALEAHLGKLGLWPPTSEGDDE